MKKSSLTKIGAMVLLLAIAIPSCTKKNQSEPAASPVSQTLITPHSAQRLIATFESNAAFGERTDDKNEPCRHKDQSICKFSIATTPEVPTGEVRVGMGLDDAATVTLVFSREILNNASANLMFDQNLQIFTLPTNAGLQDPTGRYLTIGTEAIIRAGSYPYLINASGNIQISGIPYTK